LLLGIVVLLSFGYSRQLLRDNERLSAEAARSRSASEAAQARVLQLEQISAASRDKLVQEGRALESMQDELAALRGALAKALADLDRLKSEKAAVMRAAEDERRTTAALEGEIAELKRKLVEAQKAAASQQAPPQPVQPPVSVAAPAAADDAVAPRSSDAREPTAARPKPAPPQRKEQRPTRPKADGEAAPPGIFGQQ
jgi:hypothetical protein